MSQIENKLLYKIIFVFIVISITIFFLQNDWINTIFGNTFFKEYYALLSFNVTFASVPEYIDINLSGNVEKSLKNVLHSNIFQLTYKTFLYFLKLFYDKY